MQIDIKDLRAISETLFSHLEEQGIESVELPTDYYWNIPREEKYDPYNTPANLNVGQLTDDWSELQKVLEGETEPLGYHLVWLAAILRAIGEKVVT